MSENTIIPEPSNGGNGGKKAVGGSQHTALEEVTFIPGAETIPPFAEEETLFPQDETTIPPDDTAAEWHHSSVPVPTVDDEAAQDETDSSTIPPITGGTPEYIGPFAVKDKLGHGAMGWVYLAEQLKPKRLVALKLIHRDVATHAFRARFEQEYQTLAGMNHDNVARIYSVGTTADGAPYFSMEYIDGAPIDQHCQTFGLSLQARLRLFLQVCDGVLHAHQRAVVHRDLKPANILVADEGRRACAKLIDFGIAKNLKQAVKQDMLETQIGSLVGTPAYMSPEQFGGGKIPVDTRTDVYSLGVLLYQLLTDQLPLEGDLFEGKSWDQCIQIYRETEPPPPSQRAPLPDDQRACFNTPNPKSLRGDLDWICLKAMKKTLDHRYETVAALRQDILNYLENRPVSAGPPSLVYHLRKTLRRHRNLVVAGTTLAFGLSIGLAAAFQSWRQTEVQRAKATYLSEFLWGILESPDPMNKGREAKLVDLIDEAVYSLDSQLENEPEIKASIQARLGATYKGLGSYDQALPLLESALKTHRQIFGDHAPVTLQAQFDLAQLFEFLDQHQKAKALYEKTLEARRRILGPDHPKTRQTVNCYADSLSSVGDYEEAIDTYLSNLGERFRPKSGGSKIDQDESYIRALAGLASGLMHQGEYRAASQVLEETIPLQKSFFGPADPRTLAAINNQAICLRTLHHFAAAEFLHRSVAEIREKRMGANHPATLKARAYVGTTLREQKRNHEAYAVLCEVWEQQYFHFPHLEDWLYTANYLGYVVYALDGRDGAKHFYADLYTKLKRNNLETRPSALNIIENYAHLLIATKDWQKAENYIGDQLNLFQRVGGTEKVLPLRELLAECYLALEKPAKAHAQLQFIYNYAPNEQWKKKALELAQKASLQLSSSVP